GRRRRPPARAAACRGRRRGAGRRPPQRPSPRAGAGRRRPTGAPRGGGPGRAPSGWSSSVRGPSSRTSGGGPGQGCAGRWAGTVEAKAGRAGRQRKTPGGPARRGVVRTRPGYQSLARVSPPAGVRAAHQVVALTLELTNRTLPSPIPTSIPPEWNPEATPRSQKPNVLVAFCGWTRNLAFTPVYQRVPSIPTPPPNTADSRSPGKLSWLVLKAGFPPLIVPEWKMPRIHHVPPWAWLRLMPLKNSPVFRRVPGQ